MKRKMISWLALVAVFLVSYSCRNDMLPEKEIFENSSQFQLTSRRMSLAESKHKLQLLPEISEAQTLLRSVKSNVAGKIIDYGNGTSIDTNDVIYIENGPNYHTYTFNIIRENAPANAPVENLVLSPLSDGTYREILVSYYITDQEKEILRSGGTVDTKNKVTYQSLETGSFQSGITSKTQDCHLEINFYYTECSENMHHHGEQYPECTANQPSELVYVITEVCTDTSGGSDNPWNPNFPDLPGGGGGGEEGGSSTPCNGNGVLTGPQTPASGIGYDSGDGCTGVPTSPNIPNLSNPCAKAQVPVGNINTLLHDSNISSEMNALKNYAATNHYEYGAAIINTGNSNVAQTPYTNNDPNDPGHVSIIIPPVGNYLASVHTHPDHGAAPPSARDLYSTLENARDYPSYQGSSVFSYNGSQYAFVVNDRAKAIAFVAAFPFASNTTDEGRIFNEASSVGRDFLEIYKHYMTGRLPSYSGTSQDDGMESAYAQILEKYDTGISFAKADANGNLKPLKPVSFQHEISSSGGKKITGYKAQPCP
ncbi:MULTISPECIES: hypothetical protein [unclassified Chryseobacterium]|uniref:hypothetical protein n=1 Tax=unclassified Chryseobacterium TaxID=2593645 RepID=UPI003017F3DC